MGIIRQHIRLANFARDDLEELDALALEADAIRALMPAISACIDQQQSVRFSASVIRGMVAEPLYRLTQAKLSAPKS